MSSYVVSDTIRWKVVKMAHNIKDDMEVAKILLDCYDAIISGCLQWENNKKKTRLPFCTSEKGWKLLEDIMYMMEWNDRQEERWRSLTVWNDDDKEEEEDNEEVKVTKKKGLILEGEALETTQQEEGVRGQNETAGQCEEKPSVKTTKRRPHVVDHAGVDDGDSEDDNNDVYDDKNDNDWTPQEQISEDEQVKATSQSTKSPVKKTKSKSATKGHKKSVGRHFRAAAILYSSTQVKVIECKRCFYRADSVEDFRKHFESHPVPQAVLVGNKVHKVSDMELNDIPLVANILIPCQDCGELQATCDYETHRTNKHFRRNCELCGNLYTSFGGWSRHMKTHKAEDTGIKPHVCDKCGKAFSLIGTLTQHRKLHSHDRSHICEICGKGFKIRTRLNRHMSIHSDKLFSCEFCDKTFNYKFNLKTHLRTHTGERPFSCSICGKSYSHNNSLKVHAKSEHGIDMEYGCQALTEFEDLSSETSVILAKQQRS